MRQINYDNDEMIKRLKKNIKENERILFERTSNIEKIKRDLRNQNIGENEKSNKDNFNKEPSKDTFGSKSSFKYFNIDEEEYHKQNEIDNNTTEKNSAFWVPFDQPHELTYSQKQKALKLNKRSTERANHIKKHHKENNIEYYINKNDELNTWKPRYMPI